tara:strand:+ start:298 stop:981 length:684 start_codon:yes stop_codon:yes gene_type:complete
MLVDTEELNKKFSDMKAQDIIELCLEKIFFKKISYVCSFGAESAVMLHLISKINNSVPIIFLNTLKLFDETISYKNILSKTFNLKNVIEVFPNKFEVEKYDSNENLWSKNPDLCCEIRKVKPLNISLQGFNAWFSGRKSYHSYVRSLNKFIDIQDQKYIISPLLKWSNEDINSYFKKTNIKKHPLTYEGYLSIGCQNCTVKTSKKNDVRSGRWNGLEKTECGIFKKN